jgi:hypothetical protein
MQMNLHRDPYSPRGKILRLRVIFWRLAAGLILYLLIEAAVFHTTFYASMIDPESSSGTVETLIRNEKDRIAHDRNQVLAVGDSRMAILPRMANEHHVGYRFASIAIGGSTPRCWYYMLRDTDPTAHRYAAVVVPVNDYDLRDTVDNLTDRILDLNYVIGRLRVADLPEFTGSYQTRANRWMVFRSGLLKGYFYKRDFQEFLRHPADRLALVKLIRQGSAGWTYNFVPETHSLAGLAVDWAAKKITFPNGLTEAQRALITNVLLRRPSPQTGANAAYHRYWYGRILDLYRGSGTKVIFIRLPRAPLLPPNLPPPLPSSPLRAFAALPDVVLLDEHRFDELERPELFGDPMHLNGEGILRFSRILAEEVRRILGPQAVAHAL